MYTYTYIQHNVIINKENIYIHKNNVLINVELCF
jgi:hypothetical protein